MRGAPAEREGKRQTHRAHHQRKRDHQSRKVRTTHPRCKCERTAARVSRKNPQTVGKSTPRCRSRSSEDRTRRHARSTSHLRRTLQNVRQTKTPGTTGRTAPKTKNEDEAHRRRCQRRNEQREKEDEKPSRLVLHTTDVPSHGPSERTVCRAHGKENPSSCWMR